MEKLWKLKALKNLDTSQHLQKEIKVPKVISDLLVLRGVRTFSDAKNFFRPELNQLHDPFLMKDMGKAVEIIFEVIEDNKKTMIYGDYDVDGITSVSVLHLFFKKFGLNTLTYIPCLLYTSPSPRDKRQSRMPSSA